MIREPAHVPAAQVVAAHQPPDAIAPVEDRQIPHQPTLRPQHRRQPRASRGGQASREDKGKERLRPRAGHAESREAGNVQKPGRAAHRRALLRNNAEGVGPLQRGFLDEIGRGREIARHLQPVADPPARPRRGHRVMGGGHLQRPPRGQLLVGVAHHEPAGVELARRLADVAAVGGVVAVAGHVHAEDVRLRLSPDHPLRQRLAHAAPLQEARHHRAGAPVAGHAPHRAHQRVPVGREGERPVHPGLHADLLQRGVAFEPHDQLPLDPVGLFLEQLHPVVPGRAVHRPVFVVDLVDAQQDALLVLPQVGEPLEVHGHGDLALHLLQLRDPVGDEVVMLQRRDRQLDPRHPPHLFRPETRGIDDVLAGDVALVRLHPPALRRPV